jgi:hypothetical protein
VEQVVGEQVRQLQIEPTPMIQCAVMVGQVHCLLLQVLLIILLAEAGLVLIALFLGVMVGLAEAEAALVLVVLRDWAALPVLTRQVTAQRELEQLVVPGQLTVVVEVEVEQVALLVPVLLVVVEL